jgi:lipopolysaccharide/colanic/teichoic acid biosynthesis glycosyltransferase
MKSQSFNTGTNPARTMEMKSSGAIPRLQDLQGRSAIKRLFDITFSFIALFVFALPATLITLLLVFRERHSILFMQERMGKNKKPFRILKFQTLVDQIPTRTGQLLRSTGLDELPQFLNVLKGDMSIVGPRALTKFDVERLGWDDKYHEIRWKLKPGITGLAQLYGGQHRKTSWFLDDRYIKNNNLLIDSGIIGVSFLMNLFGKTKVRKIIFQKKHLR